MIGEWRFDAHFVKTPRQLVELLASEPLALAVYMVLLNRAAWKETAVLTKHGVQRLQAGQAFFGRRDLAVVCGANESTIRTALKRLRSLQALAIKSTKLGSVVTLCGYAETYAAKLDGQPSFDQQNAQKSPSFDQQTDREIATNGDTETETRDFENEKLSRTPPMAVHCSSSELSTTELIERFDSQHLDVTGEPTNWRRSDRKRMHELVEQFGKPEVAKRIGRLFADAPHWFRDQSPRTFVENFDHLLELPAH